MHRLHVGLVHKVTVLLRWKEEATMGMTLTMTMTMVNGPVIVVGLIPDQSAKHGESLLLDGLHLPVLHSVVRLQVIRQLAIALFFRFYDFCDHLGWSWSYLLRLRLRLGLRLRLRLWLRLRPMLNNSSHRT